MYNRLQEKLNVSSLQNCTKLPSPLEGLVIQKSQES
jgi:hypothetical protein